MPVIGRKKSVLLSKIVCYIILSFLTVSIFLIPTFVGFYTDEINPNVNYETIACVVLYVSLVPAFVADFFLLKLLNNIKKENIFIRANVRSLRIIAWSCFFVGAIYTITGFYFYTAFVIAFAAYFFFLIIHVIKNIFDAAVALKEENDYTI